MIRRRRVFLRPRFCILHSAFCILLLLVPSLAHAQETTWTLLTADLTTEPVVLKSMDGSGLKVAPVGGGEERAVPLDRFVELTRTLPPAAAGGKFDLHL